MGVGGGKKCFRLVLSNLGPNIGMRGAVLYICVLKLRTSYGGEGRSVVD